MTARPVFPSWVIGIGTCVAIGAAVVLTGARPAAQRGAPPAGQQQVPTFRATTDLVLLDVSVLDKKRQVVRGLKKEDFSILEDGVPQDIATFNAVDLPDADVPSAKWMTHAARDVETNAMPDGRLILIYLDERQPANDPFATKGTKDAAHAIVDQLSPKDVAAVGFMLDHRGAQEFTTDKARLHAAIDTYSASQPVGVPLLGVLRDLSNLFASIPERRKIIIYIGQGQPYDLEVLTGMDKMTTHDNFTPTYYQSAQQQQHNNLLTLMEAANRANVAIYTIDPFGLDNSSPSAPNKEFLRLVANTTGARAIIGNNSPASQVPLILGENASYYLMAFKPSNPSEAGKFRRIEVKVNRKDVEVRARRGYVEGRGGPTIQAGTNPALGRLIPATQLGVGLWAQPAAMDPSGEHNVAMLMDVTLPRDGARPNEHLAVAWSIVDMSGKDRGTGRQDLTVSPPAGASDEYVATVQALANLPPGHYDIRVSAQLVERNRRGGLLGDVVVPDYAKDPLSASGVFVGAVAPASGAANQLARFLSVKPTIDREFAAADAIVAAMRVYQTKQPLQTVTVHATILDSKDKVVYDNSQHLEAGSFTDGAADYRLPLPLGQVGTGPLLLRLEASRPGAPTVLREVPFSVK